MVGSEMASLDEPTPASRRTLLAGSHQPVCLLDVVHRDSRRMPEIIALIDNAGG